jgi:predicted RNase H-like HicB family nuclease
MKPRHVIQAVIRSGDESGYVAECVDLPVVTQGATIEESLSNLREAVGLMLDGEDLITWNLAPNPTIMVMIELEPDYA